MSEIRYKRLGYVALNVSDLPRSIAFYRDIVGLSPVPTDLPNTAMFRCSDGHHDVMLCEGGEPGIKRIGWWMESAQALNAVRKKLADLGRPIVPVSNSEAVALGIGGDSFRSTEPAMGAVFEFFADFETTSDAYEPTHTKIARLGHVVMKSPMSATSEMFMLEDLNFRASDRIEDAITFMRCFPNPFHHSFGVSAAQDGKPQFHHINFMVTEIDDVGKALYRLKANDVQIVFGPGRHPPSESIFLYFLDPDGLTVEYSFGMEEFAEDDYREPRRLPMSMESVDYWGGAPSPQMAAKGVVEQLEPAGAS